MVAIKLFHSYNNSLIPMAFISNKMGSLHIIQDQPESILMKYFLRNGLVEEAQVIGQHIHLI